MEWKHDNQPGVSPLSKNPRDISKPTGCQVYSRDVKKLYKDLSHFTDITLRFSWRKGNQEVTRPFLPFIRGRDADSSQQAPSGPQQLQQLAAHCSCCHSLCQTDTLLPQVFGGNWNAFRQYIKDRFFFSHSWVLLSSQFHSPRSQECNAEISQVFFVIWIELTHFYDDYQFLIKSFCVNCQKKNIERKITLL